MLFISISDILAEGYVKVGDRYSIVPSIGSGIVSSDQPTDIKYPIYHPLILSTNDRERLMKGSSLLVQIVNGRINLLKRAHQLINSVLKDSSITLLALAEALRNFCYDYHHHRIGSVIRQPINYVMDVVGIDGVYFPKGRSVSYLPPDLEYVVYK